MLSKETWPSFRGNDKDAVEYLMKFLNIPQDGYELGKTKIFIKQPKTVFLLEELRTKEMPWIVTNMQKTIRGYIARKRFNKSLALQRIAGFFRWARVRERTTTTTSTTSTKSTTSTTSTTLTTSTTSAKSTPTNQRGQQSQQHQHQQRQGHKWNKDQHFKLIFFLVSKTHDHHRDNCQAGLGKQGQGNDHQLARTTSRADQSTRIAADAPKEVVGAVLDQLDPSHCYWRCTAEVPSLRHLPRQEALAVCFFFFLSRVTWRNQYTLFTCYLVWLFIVGCFYFCHVVFGVLVVFLGVFLLVWLGVCLLSSLLENSNAILVQQQQQKKTHTCS